MEPRVERNAEPAVLKIDLPLLLFAGAMAGFAGLDPTRDLRHHIVSFFLFP